MQNKKEPLKKVIGQTWKALKALFVWYPRLGILVVLGTIIKAVIPYITIWFSARIITELAGMRDAHRLFVLVVQALGAVAAATFINGFITRFKEAEKKTFFAKRWVSLSEKMLSMDFVRLDKAETMEELASIKQNDTGSGAGFHRLLTGLENLLAAITTIFSTHALLHSTTMERPTQAGLSPFLPPLPTLPLSAGSLPSITVKVEK